MAGSMVYRLRVADPDAEHIATFREAMRQIQALQDNRGYQWIAGFHGAPGGWCWHHQRFRGIQTQARLFLPWHRAYLYTLEQALQDRVDGAALPWWDWSVQRGIPPAYALPQVDNQPNPLHHFDINLQPPLVSQPIQHATRRNPNDPSQLPPPQWLTQLLDTADFETFNDISESLHDQIHGWVGGDMGVVETAAFDPIFWAHHCMIDRLWSIWQVRHGADRFPQALLDVPLRPFAFTVRDVLDTQALGYEYALQSTSIPLGALADA